MSIRTRLLSVVGAEKYKEKESVKFKCSWKKYVIFIFLVVVVIYVVNGSM